MNMITSIKNIKKTRSALRQYGDYYQHNKRELCKLLWYYKTKKHYRIATWGAGFKGTAFLATTDRNRRFIDFVIDVNSKLHRTKLSTGHYIINSNNIKERKIDVILVMNSNFYAEIYLELLRVGYHGILIDIDNTIIQQIDAKQIIKSNPTMN